MISNGLGVLPLVSVIVATYRRDCERALKSLIYQTYDNMEIVIVDDNGCGIWNKKVEATIDRIRLLSNKIIKYIKNDTNKGSGEARNMGVKIARGDYVTFLDDDDVYLPNKVKNQLLHMLEKGSDYSLTDLYLYYDDDRISQIRKRSYLSNYSEDELLKLHLLHHMTGTDCMMFKREYLLDIGGFPQINVSDEFYLMLRAIQGGGKFSYLPLCDVKAYVHTTTKGLSSGEGMICGENKLYEFKKKFFNGLSKGEIKYIKMRHFAVLAFANLRRRNWLGFLKNSLLSLITSPVNSAKLFLSLKVRGEG